MRTIKSQKGVSVNLRNAISGQMKIPSGEILPEDWLELIVGIILEIKPFLPERICHRSINELLFNTSHLLDDLGVHVETKGWEKVLRNPNYYVDSRFKIVGVTSITKKKGDDLAAGILVVNDSGDLFWFLLHFTADGKKTDKAKFSTVRVRECSVIEQRRMPEKFRKKFVSLSKNTPNFFHYIFINYFRPILNYVEEVKKNVENVKMLPEIFKKFNFSE